MKEYKKTLREFIKDFNLFKNDTEHSLSSVTEVRLAEVFLRDKRVIVHDYLDDKVKGYTEKDLCFGVVKLMDSVYSYKLFEIYLDDETPNHDEETDLLVDVDDDDLIECD